MHCGMLEAFSVHVTELLDQHTDNDSINSKSWWMQHDNAEQQLC
jgi:hypothetical protein